MDLRSAVLILGPYRNLTTLTASGLALHPKCQVLNHAFQRMQNAGKLAFFDDYSDKAFDEFCEYAVTLSDGGQQGTFGGSITYSHAFENESVRAIYKRLYGEALIKESIQSIVWKESLLLSQFLATRRTALDEVLAKNSKLRFLMPIRSPLDCAMSNLRTRHQTRVMRLPQHNFASVLESILFTFAQWFEMKSSYPARFFDFFAFKADRNTFFQMAQFLKIDASPAWLDNMESVFQIRPSHPVREEMRKTYESLIEKHLGRYPEVCATLLKVPLSITQ